MDEGDIAGACWFRARSTRCSPSSSASFARCVQRSGPTPISPLRTSPSASNSPPCTAVHPGSTYAELTGPSGLASLRSGCIAHLKGVIPVCEPLPPRAAIRSRAHANPIQAQTPSEQTPSQTANPKLHPRAISPNPVRGQFLEATYSSCDRQRWHDDPSPGCSWMRLSVRLSAKQCAPFRVESARCRQEQMGAHGNPAAQSRVRMAVLEVIRGQLPGTRRCGVHRCATPQRS